MESPRNDTEMQRWLRQVAVGRGVYTTVFQMINVVYGLVLRSISTEVSIHGS